MKKIYNRRIAMALRQMGNPLIDCEINKNKEGFLIYLFADTPKLRDDLTTLSLNK